MTRDINSALAADLAATVTTFAVCWRIARTDGEEFFFTDHDVDIIVDGDTYLSAKGISANGVRQSRDLSVDNMEIISVLSDTGISETDIHAALFDRAQVDVFMVDYVVPEDGVVYIAKGWEVGSVEISDMVLKCEIRGKSQKLQQAANEVFTPDCRATLGDARCGIDLEDSAGTYWYAGSVTSVVEDTKKFIDSATIQVDDDPIYEHGCITWITGANAGARMEVKAWNYATGLFELFQAMQNNMEVGDTFTVTWGCDKSVTTCHDRFDNVPNFRGEPLVPGMDATMRANTR